MMPLISAGAPYSFRRQRFSCSSASLCQSWRKGREFVYDLEALLATPRRMLRRSRFELPAEDDDQPLLEAARMMAPRRSTAHRSRSIYTRFADVTAPEDDARGS